MKICVYQGIRGSFSHQAAGMWDENLILHGKNSFRDVFETLHSHAADFALIPLENSLAGSIHENYDLLARYPMQIIGEVYYRVDHCLLSKGDDVAKVRKVLSHPKALEQCTQLFKGNPDLEACVFFDTAGAAEEIARNGDPKEAAIGSRALAEMYGLNILQEKIQDYPENFTRFAIVARSGASIPEDANKCSILFTLPHAPGALAAVLQTFANRGINLMKIESRPKPMSVFEYNFYADCECKDLAEMKLLLKELQAVVNHLQILGFYKAGSL